MKRAAAVAPKAIAATNQTDTEGPDARLAQVDPAGQERRLVGHASAQLPGTGEPDQVREPMRQQEGSNHETHL